MSEPLYLGIDLGTQSVRVLAVERNGAVTASAAEPFRSRREGVRHEQEPESWWLGAAACLRQAMNTVGPGRRIGGIAVDATSGTILLGDVQGRALSPALMYDDGRAAAEAIRVEEAGRDLWAEMGYRIQPSWALPKLLWLAQTFSALRTARLLHQNDFVNARLAGRVLASDWSHALKTGYDLVRTEWPWKVMDALNIPSTMLPEIVAPGTKIGEIGVDAAQETGVPEGTPIFAGMTDGCAAQIAAGAMQAGSWNTVIGTTLVVKGATRERVHDPLGVLYSHRSADGLWLPGGASSTGAAAIAAGFAKDDLSALNTEAERSGPTSLVVYPLVSKGERFPFVAPEAEGFTLGNAKNDAERYRGVLQGIAMIERLAFDRLRQLGVATDGRFSISGGAVKSEPLNQMRADMLERELSVPAITEGAFGMAMLAASAESSMEECVQRMVKVEKTYRPKRPFAEYAAQYEVLVNELYGRGWLPEELRAAATTGRCA